MERPAFRVPLRINPEDIDALGHVNNVVYLQWVQEAAAAHWDKLASPEERQQVAWLVMRHEIDYRHAALLGDAVYALTRVGETEGVRSVRYVDMYKEPGILLASARTTWVMVDAQTQRPRRIGPEFLAVLDRQV